MTLLQVIEKKYSSDEGRNSITTWYNKKLDATDDGRTKCGKASLIGFLNKKKTFIHFKENQSVSYRLLIIFHVKINLLQI